MVELTALALAVWMECRSCEKDVDRVAVAHTIMNRVEDTTGEFRHRNSVYDVISQPGHFPWYGEKELILDNVIEQTAWKDAKSVARNVLEGNTLDPTNGAKWFHRNDVSFGWTATLQRVEIGSRIHTFWKLSSS